MVPRRRHAGQCGTERDVRKDAFLDTSYAREVLMSTLCEEAQQQQDVPDLVPARMLNEFAYCPRLAYLEWVQGEFADNLEVLEGRFGHRRVEQPSRH